jgi:hypothetical protein
VLQPGSDDLPSDNKGLKSSHFDRSPSCALAGVEEGVNGAACGFRPEDGRGWGEGGLVLLGEGAGPPAIGRLGWGRWGRARARLDRAILLVPTTTAAQALALSYGNFCTHFMNIPFFLNERKSHLGLDVPFILYKSVYYPMTQRLDILPPA